MKKLVILSGAGMSAESGIPTFSGTDGLWENHDIMEIASPQGWKKNRELVMKFYNERRKKLLECEPNKGHYGLVELEKYFDVQIVTQNIDDLHERAGSSKILHLHGELRKSRSSVDENLIYNIEGWEIKIGDKCEKGSQLRPHIVWFGEAVTEFKNAIKICESADIMVIIGTSMVVYPAASLINYVPEGCKIFLIDPNDVATTSKNIQIIKKGAGEGVEILKEILLKENF